MNVITHSGASTLHRHQLAWLGGDCWSGLIDQAADGRVSDCLAHWAKMQLPLVVTRQPTGIADGLIALGLPTPGCWGRLRLNFSVARTDVLRFDEFPYADEVLALLPAAARQPWRRLCAQLASTQTTARVYGSYGWQLLSGLDHARVGSDIDLWLTASCVEQADSAAACLASFSSNEPRLDGELMFSDGAAVAWREWLVWRAGRVQTLLVKNLHGCSMTNASRWQAATAMAASG